MTSSVRRWMRRPGRAVPAAAAVLVAIPLLAAAVPAPGGYHGKLWSPYPAPVEKPVPGHPLPAGSGAVAAARFDKAIAAREPGLPGTRAVAEHYAWPAAGAATVPLSKTSAAFARAGSLPVEIAEAGGWTGRLRVSVASHAAAVHAGIPGVLFTVGAGAARAGRVRVRLLYRGFAGAYGGAWSSRLRLAELPACVLTAPQRAACRKMRVLRGTNNDLASDLTATVALGSQVVLAATAGPSGPTGDYTATPLKQSGSWAVQQGDFTYDYPIIVPPALGGGTPHVSLTYDAQSIDSETSAANTQAGQIGDGWDFLPGFIERSYEPCTQAGVSNSGDECWAGYNGVISLGGQSGNLVKVSDDSGGGSTWKLQSDDGTKIQLIHGADNGLWSGEYWLVTTTDGTRYYFGLNHLPGTASSGAATDSAWGVPVYNPGSTDPCYSSSAGKASLCPQNMGWRWNLDYVVSPGGNLTVYNYASETSYYERGAGLNNGNGTLARYDRGGYLTGISYGWLLPDAVAGNKPAAQVSFGYSDRCTSTDATTCAAHAAANWPDVPWDQNCGSSGTCTNYSPTYWTTKMLTSITTEVLDGSSYDTVDTYELDQEFLTGANSNAVIFLQQVTRTTGQSAKGVPLIPSTTFTPVEIDNRVDGLVPPALAVMRPRIETVVTGTGEQIGAIYANPACSRVNSTMPSSADTNTMPCFPVYWTPPGSAQIQDWFNKSLVSQISVADVTGAGSPTQETNYKYLGGAAWHQDQAPVVKSSQRTWDEYRGYHQVEVTTGVAPDPVTETLTTYMRGMNGDALSAGGTRSVSVTDTLGDSYPDDNWLAGQVLETDTYTESGGSIDAKTVNGPWSYDQTGSQSEPAGAPTLTAHLLRQSQSRTLDLLASRSWRTRAVTSYYDTNGQVVAVDDEPDGSAETCTATGYAAPASGNPMMLDYPDQVTVVTGAASGGACPAASSGNIVSDTRYYYDDSSATLTSMGTLGSLASPGGLVTGVQKTDTWPAGGGEHWVPQSVTAYDEYGRVTSATNARNKTTETAYIPAEGTLPTTQTVTNPVGWTTVTVLDPGRQIPVKITDPNGEVTTESYDPLGRLSSVTVPYDQGTGYATQKFSYSIPGNAPPSITTQKLRADGTYSLQVDLYDGMLQLRQEQTTPLNAGLGRLVSDTTYDTHGWVATTSKPFYDNSVTAPDTTIYVATDAQIPSQTVTQYDGQGRTTSATFYSLGHKQWQTSTAYPGMDETDVTPPAGGTATSTFTNALGQTTASWRYTTATPTGSSADADKTTYAYTPAGQVAAVTDNSKNVTSYLYDLLSEKTSQTSPDTGTTSYRYDPAGDLSSVTDADGTTLTYLYDSLNRKTDEYQGTATTGVKLASWTYDTLEKGYLTSSTAYSGSAQYTEAVTGYNAAYEPTGNSVTIPSQEGTQLAGTYSTSQTYTPLTGQLYNLSYNGDGGLPPETLTYSYNMEGLLNGFGGNAPYLNGTGYTPQGQVLKETYGVYGEQLVQDDNWDAGTWRLLTATTNLQTSSSAADTVSYTYNPAGEVTSVSDSQDGGAATQLQCYTYDNLDRLTQAWTDTGGTTTAAAPSVSGIGGCTHTSPSASSIGGPAPYWESWTYNMLGDRTGQVIHDTSGNTAGDITQAITYPGTSTAGASLTDAADSITTTGPGGTVTTSSTYNNDGDTTARASTSTGTSPPPAPPGQPKITYTPQGRTQTVTTASGSTTSYQYDADGNLLIQKDPGTTTVYLFGAAEELILDTSTSKVSGLRFYDGSPSGITVIRSSAATDPVSYEVTDTQGTALDAVNATTLAETRRYYDPYGQAAGARPSSWPDSNTFLGKPADPATSLDLLGARQYDPATGAFLSPDPVFQPGTLAAGLYTYAADNPVTNTDPSGLYISGCGNSCGITGGGSGSGNGNGGGGSGGGGSGGSSGGGGPGSGCTTGCTPHQIQAAAVLLGIPPANLSGFTSAVQAIEQQRLQEVDYEGGGCNGRVFALGGCPSEAGAAGTTPAQVKQSFLGALMVLSTAIPVGDLLDLAGLTARAPEAAAGGTATAAARTTGAATSAVSSSVTKWVVQLIERNEGTGKFIEGTHDVSDYLGNIANDLSGQPPSITQAGVDAGGGAGSPAPYSSSYPGLTGGTVSSWEAGLVFVGVTAAALRIAWNRWLSGG
jgi:RHS repeat-associated protein